MYDCMKNDYNRIIPPCLYERGIYMIENVHLKSDEEFSEKLQAVMELPKVKYTTKV